MRQDTEQKGDATTRASPSNDKSMKDKREEARRMADELLSEERGRGKSSSILTTYLIAVIVGLAIWAALYYLWLSL